MLTTKFREEMHKQSFAQHRFGGVKLGSQPCRTEFPLFSMNLSINVIFWRS